LFERNTTAGTFGTIAIWGLAFLLYRLSKDITHPTYTKLTFIGVTILAVSGYWTGPKLVSLLGFPAEATDEIVLAKLRERQRTEAPRAGAPPGDRVDAYAATRRRLLGGLFAAFWIAFIWAFPNSVDLVKRILIVSNRDRYHQEVFVVTDLVYERGSGEDGPSWHLTGLVGDQQELLGPWDPEGNRLLPWKDVQTKYSRGARVPVWYDPMGSAPRINGESLRILEDFPNFWESAIRSRNHAWLHVIPALVLGALLLVAVSVSKRAPLS
jgi:hypothetical protein